MLPIELLNSFRLLARSRCEYLDAIIDFNRAQFELYVAMGQPPVAVLSRPVPTDGIAPTQVEAPPRRRRPSCSTAAAPTAVAAAASRRRRRPPRRRRCRSARLATVPTTPNGPSR